MLGAGSILAGAFIGAGIGALSTTAMKAGEEISTGNVRSAKEAFRDVGISAVSGFITGAFGAKFPGAHRLTEGVVDTAVSAGERLAYAVFDDSMSWDEKWAYAFDPGQMVADFVTGGDWHNYFNENSYKLIGRAGIEHREIDGELCHEIGYLIDKAYQGRGYAYEACTFIIGYAAVQLGIDKLYACIHKDNYLSQSLAVKLGFTVYKEMGDDIIYTIKL